MYQLTTVLAAMSLTISDEARELLMKAMGKTIDPLHPDKRVVTALHEDGWRFGYEMNEWGDTIPLVEKEGTYICLEDRAEQYHPESFTEVLPVRCSRCGNVLDNEEVHMFREMWITEDLATCGECGIIENDFFAAREEEQKYFASLPTEEDAD